FIERKVGDRVGDDNGFDTTHETVRRRGQTADVAVHSSDPNLREILTMQKRLELGVKERAVATLVNHEVAILGREFVANAGEFGSQNNAGPPQVPKESALGTVLFTGLGGKHDGYVQSPTLAADASEIVQHLR